MYVASKVHIPGPTDCIIIIISYYLLLFIIDNTPKVRKVVKQK